MGAVKEGMREGGVLSSMIVMHSGRITAGDRDPTSTAFNQRDFALFFGCRVEFLSFPELAEVGNKVTYTEREG
jgi:hypothetical protein